MRHCLSPPHFFQAVQEAEPVPARLQNSCIDTALKQTGHKQFVPIQGTYRIHLVFTVPILYGETGHSRNSVANLA